MDLREPFDFPDLAPAPRHRDHARSKRPLIIFGERGTLHPRTGLRTEEATVLERRTPGSEFPDRYLGWWVPLARGADEDSRRRTFRDLMLRLPRYGESDPDDPAGVLVPKWDELQRESRQVAELLRVACAHTLTVTAPQWSVSEMAEAGATAVFESARLSLVPRSEPVLLLRIDEKRGAKRLREVRKAGDGDFVTRPERHLEWLNAAAPTGLEFFGPIFGLTPASTGDRRRDFDAARTGAAKLVSQGRLSVSFPARVFGALNQPWPVRGAASDCSTRTIPTSRSTCLRCNANSSPARRPLQNATITDARYRSGIASANAHISCALTVRRSTRSRASRCPAPLIAHGFAGISSSATACAIPACSRR